MRTEIKEEIEEINKAIQLLVKSDVTEIQATSLTRVILCSGVTLLGLLLNDVHNIAEAARYRR